MWGLLKGLLDNIPAVIVIFVAVLVLGFVALTRLPVDLFPEIEVPVVAVRIDYSGASPEDVEKNIARIIEGQFLTISGVRNVITRCFEGFAFFVVQFDYGVNIDLVANDVRERMDLVFRLLPDGVGKPQIFKFDPSSLPILSIGITGIDDLSALKELVDNNISKRIYQVDGVASVSIEGGYDKKVFVELDSKRLNGFLLSPSDVVRAIAGENQNFPAGFVIDGYKKVNLRFSSEFNSIQDIENTIVANRGRYVVKIKDVANVSFKEDRVDAPIVKINGQDGIVLSINKKSGSSTVVVSEAVKKKLEEIKRLYPNLKFNIINDQGEFIVFSINNVRNNAINGALLAIIIVFIFLVRLKETILIGIAIPFSLIITFVFMYFLDISLNVVSLTGLALGVGLMVDNSIVVLESIYLKLRQGKRLVDATFEGTKEVGTAILASTITTVVVFVPVVFAQGIAGQLFRDLALTVSISVFSSLFVAIFIVPPLASRYWYVIEELDAKIQSNYYLSWFSNFIDRVRDGIYEKSLNAFLNLKKTTLVFTVVFIILGFVSFVFVGKEFLPIVDTGNLNVRIDLPTGTYKDITSSYAEKISEYLLSNQNVDYFYYVIASVGTGNLGFLVGRGNENTINMFIKLKPKEQRNISSEEFASQLRKFISTIPGRYRVNVVNGVGFAEGGGANVDVKLFGENLLELEEISKRIKEVATKVEGIQEINSSFDDESEEYSILFDRNKLGFYGVSSGILGNIIRTSFSGAIPTFYRVEGKQYQVVVKLREDERRFLENVLFKYIPTPTGVVPLVDLIEVKKITSPRMIMRENNSRQVSLSVVGFGVAQSKLVENLAEVIKKEVYIPPDVVIEYGGSFRDLQDTFRDLILVFILAFTLVYSVMVILFRSFKDPFIILFTIPYGIFAVLIGFFILGLKINVISGIGVVLLLGIIVNNGIVMVDYMNQLLDKGYRLRDAVIDGAKRRFRPILMTTLTTVFGVLPLALGIGASSEIFQPLGQVIAVGLTMGTIFTLFVIPTIFEYFNRKRFA
ncbi:MAG: efflux RND transporter permease subunit [Brevinematales bacterium]|nr:efflux RND transporter permease subunit [Brevinematales bacterium]